MREIIFEMMSPFFCICIIVYELKKLSCKISKSHEIINIFILKIICTKYITLMYNFFLKDDNKNKQTKMNFIQKSVFLFSWKGFFLFSILFNFLEIKVIKFSGNYNIHIFYIEQQGSTRISFTSRLNSYIYM